jgi:hypothetical protein
MNFLPEKKHNFVNKNVLCEKGDEITRFDSTFSVKLNISVSACYSFLNRHCLDEQGKQGQNVPLRYNCANSIGADNWLYN